MRRYRLNNLQRITRWFLLIVVMIGIFFSSSVGIHLLTFPVSSNESETGVYSLRGDNHKSCNLSVHNYVNHSLSLESQFEENIKQDIVCEDLLADEFNNAKFLYLPIGQNYKEKRFSYPSNFLISPSIRAPPTV